MSAIEEQVREAYASRRPLRTRGAGTWLAAGRPVNGETVSLAEDRGIVEYVPGDLTLTARAGTRLSDIVAATGAHGQWLPLDPWGGDEGTIGATVSTGTAGPHAYAMGLPRDVVLGLEFVSGSGSVIRAGGRVVKNVAGFDLTRLVTGSWGTLGVITEVTVRLRARPDHTRTIAVAIETTPAALSELAARLRALPFTPLASELTNAGLTSHLGLDRGGGGGQALLLLRVGGNEKSLRGQVEALRALGDPRELDEGVWPKLRTCGAGDAASWRWSQLPSEFGSTWQAAADAVRSIDGAFMHGNPARGVVRVVAPTRSPAAPPAALARAATGGGFRGTVALESLPAQAWPLADTHAAGDSLSRSIRAKFDPAGIMNAGILGSAP